MKFKPIYFYLFVFLFASACASSRKPHKRKPINSYKKKKKKKNCICPKFGMQNDFEQEIIFFNTPFRKDEKVV